MKPFFGKTVVPVALVIGGFYLWYGTPLLVLGVDDLRLVEAITPDEILDRIALSEASFEELFATEDNPFAGVNPQLEALGLITCAES